MQPDIDRYVQSYPQFREELEVLQCVLACQAGHRAWIEPDLALGLEAARTRWQAGRPLFSCEELQASQFLLPDVLAELNTCLPEQGKARTTIDCLMDSGILASAPAEPLLCDMSRKGKARIQHLAAAISVDQGMLILLLCSAVTILYQQLAAPHQSWIESAAWRHGFCPLCGSEPSMARLARDDGRRILVCSLCRSEWQYDRLRCPFCEVDGRPHFRHFTVEDDPIHRVDCCGWCRRYLKTIDERVLECRANIPAEEIVTGYLDMLAREQGYR